MFKRSNICAAALITLGGTAALTSLPAFSQQVLERVEVTGSRIRNLNAEAAAPVQVLTSADIAASGATTIQELIQKNPAFGAPPISRNNSNFSTSSAGVATVDLRFLGSDRTLVLVNGRRHVAGVPGSSSVDLNTIPTDFIERVEILTGGASSTYGSDAVAGVVNIILKRSFDGLTLNAEAGRSEKGDDSKKKFSMTVGTSTAKSNLMAHLAVSKAGAVYSRDREMSAVDQFSVAEGVTGEVADLFIAKRPFFSSFAPQGRFFFSNTGSYTYDAAGKEIPFSTNGPAGDGVGATGFNRSAFRTIAIPTDRLLLATKADHNINEQHTVYFEGTYAATRTKTRLEPFPLDSSGSNGVYRGTGGWVPAEFNIDGKIVRNGLVPDYLFSRLSDQTGDGLKDYKFTRRLSDIDARGARAERDTFRVVGGLKGELSKTWSYDSYAVFGSTKEAQSSSGQINVPNFRQALESVVDVNDVNGNGSRTDLVCRDANARAEGCVPLNLFGANSISAAAGKYVAAPGSLSTKITQSVVGASVTGDAFELPAGSVGVAAGVEWRKESSRAEFDALTNAGLNAGNALPNTVGSFSVKELFAEVRAPLLKGLPLVKRLDANAAFRHGRYSTVGGVNSWSTGLDWAATSDVRIRLTNAVSTRAPNINELFNPPSQTFPTGIADPCTGIKAGDTSVTGANCLAAAGVAANIAANGGTFTLNQADKQGMSGFNIGNPALKQEKGKSLTLGMVLTPKSIAALRNFSFTADYFRIEVENSIDAPPRQFILDQCYGNGDKAFCKFVKRRPVPVGSNSAGSIEFVDAVQENSGGKFREGIDFTTSYAGTLGAGRLQASATWTHLIDAYDVPRPGAARDYLDGEIGTPRDKFSLNIGYDFNNWSIRTTTTHIAASALDDQFLKGYDLGRDAVKIGAKTYLDLQVQYKLGKAQLYIGLDNALGTKAPLIPSGLPGNTTGAETDAGTYDPIGRRYYAGVRYSF